ncbi:hypothetical protein [Halococcus sediminicola]|uniref:hypothetical protein n=1 Tax=Halococcus sediminicola TaxID=1264579 RepID=UPI0009AD943D|nr:hypothetical protein [Halococcus sediminicola]
MTDETITNITDAISRTLYGCGFGALWTRITTSTNDTTITAIRPAAVYCDDHGATTCGCPGPTSSVSVDRGAVTE